MNIETLAQQLYDACQTPKPSWDSLGDVTKGVWRERAHIHQSQGAGCAPACAVQPSSAPAATAQADLF